MNKISKKILFSEEVEIHTAKLPRWKPKIIIDRRTRERIEEDGGKGL